MKNFALYIHIPFCRQKCLYCDFVSFAGRESAMNDYAAALCREIAAEGARFSAAGYEAQSVYFGGGTPTSLPQDLLIKIIAQIFSSFRINSGAEITVEANPGTVDCAYFRALNAAGVNRLSLGVQSFDDRLLKIIGRIHTRQDALDAVAAARAADFDNISLDLMYGLPGQSLGDLRRSVETALSLPINHLSVYGLTVETGTPLEKILAAKDNKFYAFRHRDERKSYFADCNTPRNLQASFDPLKRGLLFHNKNRQCGDASGDFPALPDDDAAGDMYDYIAAELPHRDFRRYEISNYARAGFESRHNLSYWRDIPYLGLGLAAHSYGDWPPISGKDFPAPSEKFGVRYARTISPENYLAGEAVDAASVHYLTREESIEEMCFLGLRAAEGISREKFAAKFAAAPEGIFGEKIARLIAGGLLYSDEKSLKLTENGMRYGNAVWRELLLT